jgi:hypothetical protein
LPLMRLNQLPNAAAAPIPAPDPKMDVIVNVRTNATVKIVTTKP